jgi:hypothetical protein
MINQHMVADLICSNIGIGLSLFCAAPRARAYRAAAINYEDCR